MTGFKRIEGRAGRLRLVMIRRGLLVRALCAVFHVMLGQVVRIGGDRAKLPVVLFPIALPAGLKTAALALASLLRAKAGTCHRSRLCSRSCSSLSRSRVVLTGLRSNSSRKAPDKRRALGGQGRRNEKFKSKSNNQASSGLIALGKEAARKIAEKAKTASAATKITDRGRHDSPR